MTNETITLLLCSGAASAVISGIFSVVLWHLNNKKKVDDTDDAIRAGVRALLYDKIKYLGLKYIDKGEITAEELEDIHKLHKVYHDKLEGNGYLDIIMGKVDRLPVTK